MPGIRRPGLMAGDGQPRDEAPGDANSPGRDPAPGDANSPGRDPAPGVDPTPGRDPAPGDDGAPPDEPSLGEDPAGESAYDLLRRGTALLGQRHHAQAAVVLQRAAALEPHRGSILEPLGRAYFMSGQLERAHETFTALLDVDPTSPYGHYALGRTLARLGRRSEAITHLRLAVALAPGSRLYRGALERLTAGHEQRRA